ncbi:MAG: ADP-forming succinate--CoA ligase subunit beta, partial [archaeon]|nr:ADP-forming succinate--CoA ligase subunit beta [archaeon]
MKLLEYQGKELFLKYGIAVPNSVLLDRDASSVPFAVPYVLKAQVPIGDRAQEGGILFAEPGEDFEEKRNQILEAQISGYKTEKILAEEQIV